MPTQRVFLAVDGLQGTIWRIDADLKEARMMAREVPRIKDCSAWPARLLRQFAMLYR